MSNKNMKRLEKIRIFWEKYEKNMMLSAGMILIAIISFEIGFLQGHKLEQKTLVIERNPQVSFPVANGVTSGVLGAESAKSINNLNKPGSPGGSTGQNKECAYVGSKNSTKYHKSDCRWAKNIKPENLTCFKSEEEARGRGYVGDKNCVK